MIAPTLLFAVALTVSAAPAAPASADAVVLAEVLRALRSCAAFTIFDEVSAGVTDGHVTLTGRVTRKSKREAIEDIVARVDGVRAVRNALTILATSRADDDLRRAIAQSIYGNPSFWHYAVMPDLPIHIIVEHGRVALVGEVRSESDRALAKALAEQTGAVQVDDRLTTRMDMLEARDQSH